MQLARGQQHPADGPQNQRQQHRSFIHCFPGLIYGRQVPPLDQHGQGVHGALHTASVIALAKRRVQLLLDNPVAQQVRDHPLQAVTDFDPHSAVVLDHQQQNTVVDALAPQFPGAKQLGGECFEVSVARTRQQHHGDLRAFALFEVCQLLSQTLLGRGIQGMGQVDHPLVQRHILQCRRRRLRHGQRGEHHDQQAQDRLPYKLPHSLLPDVSS